MHRNIQTILFGMQPVATQSVDVVIELQSGVRHRKTNTKCNYYDLLQILPRILNY